MHRITFADILPRWLTIPRMRMLLFCSAVVILARAIYMWVNVDEWLFRRDSILYNIPIELYCVLWFNEISHRRNAIPLICFLIDMSVILLSILRGYDSFGVLLFSGHTLFLAYTCYGWWYNPWLRYSSLLILVQVVYWKYILWGDWHSFMFGLCLAFIAHILRQKLFHRYTVE
ncbi:MAG TPA: hypothetical protein PLW09_10430 [Candidatus Kapabacteria bacterium]|jgi:hypothetical protein|nr:hypothetical protein [Ignavibacteria bacterium]HRE58224.1 hypothetical protein [Candidatus Kapabacteria bacterium]HRI31779.1 hypothetical protein [Candidatus Kapabacteria bacterium]HRK59309.1 hypothetical protein [Candidatus Kapabacteria bacterium]